MLTRMYFFAVLPVFNLFSSTPLQGVRKEKKKKRKEENMKTILVTDIWKLYTFVYYPHLLEHFIVFFTVLISILKDY